MQNISFSATDGRRLRLHATHVQLDDMKFKWPTKENEVKFAFCRITTELGSEKFN